MNEYVEAIILGIVQGITEFIPVSSDGHLELAKWLLGDSNTAADSLFMTIILHFGTAFAIVWVLRHVLVDVIKNLKTAEGRKFIGLIIISMIPAVVVGVGFLPLVESLFNQQVVLVGLFLCINGVVLIVSDYLPNADKPITPVKSFLIGIAQAIAILPGISRSGSTIATSVALGIDRQKAAQYSFIMVLPLLFGKMAKDILDGRMEMEQSKALPLILGFLISFIVGVFAFKWLLAIVKKAKLSYFGFYCILIGIAAIILRLWVWTN
ncbi:MAG TPA: undecaprenyl-diphosphate phosphatase [Saprospiraceae bacterium]|nr:undecaprenyl-diphosphate phosphatase [Saprospiraceae bacterium]